MYCNATSSCFVFSPSVVVDGACWYCNLTNVPLSSIVESKETFLRSTMNSIVVMLLPWNDSRSLPTSWISTDTAAKVPLTNLPTLALKGWLVWKRYRDSSVE